MAKMTAEQRRARNTRRTAMSTFLAGAFVSVAANIISAEPTVIGRAVSAWPALALLLTVHLFQHAHRSFPVKLAIAAVAGVAAWVSYWHMVEVGLMAGESQVTAHILPATVDAMMYVATVVLTSKPKPARRAPARRKATVTPLRKVAAS